MCLKDIWALARLINFQNLKRDLIELKLLFGSIWIFSCLYEFVSSVKPKCYLTESSKTLSSSTKSRNVHSRPLFLFKFVGHLFHIKATVFTIQPRVHSFCSCRKLFKRFQVFRFVSYKLNMNFSWNIRSEIKFLLKDLIFIGHICKNKLMLGVDSKTLHSLLKIYHELDYS